MIQFGPMERDFTRLMREQEANPMHIMAGAGEEWEYIAPQRIEIRPGDLFILRVGGNPDVAYLIHLEKLLGGDFELRGATLRVIPAENAELFRVTGASSE